MAPNKPTYCSKHVSTHHARESDRNSPMQTFKRYQHITWHKCHRTTAIHVYRQTSYLARCSDTEKQIWKNAINLINYRQVNFSSSRDIISFTLLRMRASENVFGRVLFLQYLPPYGWMIGDCGWQFHCDMLLSQAFLILQHLLFSWMHLEPVLVSTSSVRPSSSSLNVVVPSFFSSNMTKVHRNL